MKKISVLMLSCVLGISYLHAQTNTFPSTGAAGIGTITPDASSLLDITSTTKGMLVPRMTQAQRNAIHVPATGVLIYQTDNTPGFYYYSGKWTAVTTKKGWLLTGNAGTVAGTNFIGTTDPQPLMLKVNNNKAGYIDFDAAKANTGFGYQALYNTTGSYNTASGFSALRANTSGNYNTGFGYQSLYSNTIGINNTACGVNALLINTEGNNNTASGTNALQNNTTGSHNTASGFTALVFNTTGFYNTASGVAALYSSIGGAYNTATGYQSLYSNNGGWDAELPQGSFNTSLGSSALYSNTTGNYNTAIGYSSGSAMNTGSNNLTIGNNAQVPTGTASNQVRIGNGFITQAGVQVAWTIGSDRRWKSDIQVSNLGLDFITKLKPVSYFRNNDESKKREYGFIAQDLEEALNTSGAGNNGIISKDDKGMYGVRYNDLIAPMVKGMQELSKMNDEKDAKINDLQQQLNDLKTLVLSIQQCSPCNTSGATAQSYNTTIVDGAALEQNIPNPFTHNTTIGYTLPQKYTTAQIMITDKSGKTLKLVNVSGSGKGNLNVDASVLASGAYNYSLLVDGKLIGTKQMEHIK